MSTNPEEFLIQPAREDDWPWIVQGQVEIAWTRLGPDRRREVSRKAIREGVERQVAEAGIPVHYQRLSIAEMRNYFEQGAVPVVLISSYRIYKEKFPHWVVVTGFDERYVYVHDPFVDVEKGKSETDCINMPILQKDFERMARYGKSGLRAALVLSQRSVESNGEKL